jgi:hypothetical protein
MTTAGGSVEENAAGEKLRESGGVLTVLILGLNMAT